MNDLTKKLLSLKKYTFHLWDYRLSHSLLVLRAERDDKPNHNVYMVFANLLYLQMPTSWIADFSVASDTEFINVVKKTNIRILYGEKSIVALKDTYSLYKAETSETIIYILGKLNTIEYDVEPVLN